MVRFSDQTIVVPPVPSELEISINDLAKLVIELSDSKSQIIYKSHEEVYGTKFEDPMRRTPSIEKIVTALGDVSKYVSLYFLILHLKTIH